MLRANGLIGWDIDLPKEKVPAIFARRHKAAFWYAVLPSVVMISSSYFVFKYPNYADIITVGFMFIGIGVYIFIMLCYRCPRCGQIPYSSQPRSGGILFFPKKCCKCRAPLLPNHKWGQD